MKAYLARLAKRKEIVITTLAKVPFSTPLAEVILEYAGVLLPCAALAAVLR